MDGNEILLVGRGKKLIDLAGKGAKRCRCGRERAYAGAYMTVEAAFIMPMVLCLFVIVIYCSFYLYDRCVFQQDAYILCLRESIQKDEGAPTVDAARLKSGAARQFGTKYFAVSRLETAASAEGRDCVFEGTAQILPTSFGSDALMPKKIWSANFRARKRKTDPAWSIRSLRRKSYVLQKGTELLRR